MAIPSNPSVFRLPPPNRAFLRLETVPPVADRNMNSRDLSERRMDQQRMPQGDSPDRITAERGRARKPSKWRTPWSPQSVSGALRPARVFPRDKGLDFPIRGGVYFRKGIRSPATTPSRLRRPHLPHRRQQRRPVIDFTPFARSDTIRASVIFGGKPYAAHMKVAAT